MGLLDSDFLSTLQSLQPQQEQPQLPWLSQDASPLAQMAQQPQLPQPPQAPQPQGGGIGSFLARLAAATNGSESLQKYDANQMSMQTQKSALSALADMRSQGVTDPQKILSTLATIDPQYAEKAATLQAQNPLAALLQGGNGAGNASSLTGDELLKSLPPSIAAQVKGIADGRMQLPGGLGGKGQALRQQLLQLVTQYDPSFDAVNYNARAATRKDFTSGKSAQNITALNTAIGHLSSLKDAYAALNNSDYPAVNSVINWAGNEFGNKNIQANTAKVGSDAHAVSEELAKVFRSSGMAESDVKAWEKKLSTSSGPAQSETIVNEALDLMNSRLDAIGQQYNQGMGTTKNGIELLSPKAQEAYQKITGVTAPKTKVTGDLAADNAKAQQTKTIAMMEVTDPSILAQLNGDEPLNVRNNNPGNMKSGGELQSFDTPKAGLDAMQRDLLTKISGNSPMMKAHFGEGYQPTLRNVISTWAPSSENDTTNYVNFVSQHSGIDPDQPLTADDVNKIMQPMVHMEGGQKASQYFSKLMGTLPEGKQYAAADNVANDAAPEEQPKEVTDPELLKQLNAGESSPDYVKDVGKSIAYRGIPEGLAAATLGGYGLNVVRGVSDLTRWAAHKAYNAATGEELPYASENPVPTSSDVLRGLAEKLPQNVKDQVGVTQNGLYEPQTLPGEYANSIAQFAAGGKATGIPLTTSIPAAVASESAGQATKGTDWETPARIMVAAATAGAIPGRSKAPLTTEETRQNASTLFKSAEDQGANLKSNLTDKWLGTANKITPQTTAGKLVLGDTPTTQLVDRLQALKGKPLSLAEAQEIDSALGDKISEHVDPKSGKLTAEGAKLSKLQQSLRETIDNASESDIVGGKSAFDTLKQARAEWAKQARMNDVDRIMQRAELTDNKATSIKTGFRNLASNPNRLRGYTKQEVAAIKYAAKTGIATGALKFAGSRLISSMTGAAGGAAGGGPIGAVIGAGAGALAGTPFRAAADALQARRGNAVRSMIANRGQVAPPNPLLNLLNNQIPSYQGIKLPQGVM